MMIILFTILTHTWGVLMALIGYMVSLVLILTKHRPRLQDGCIIFIVGNNWGGITLGNTIIVNGFNPNGIITHEKGHYVQNALMGPLFIPLVALPSLIRATYRTYVQNKGKELTTYYMDIWFEGTATLLGEYIENKGANK